jgi:hypothetical protein
MHITLRLDPLRLWRWHQELISQLESLTASRVSVVFAATTRPLNAPVWLALQIERRLLGAVDTHPFDTLTPDSFYPWLCEASPEQTDARIDLANDQIAATDGRILTPIYDGQPGEAAFWVALLAGRAPALAVYDSTRDGTIEIGQPAIESPHALRVSAAAVITRLITGLGRVALDTQGHAVTPNPSASRVPPSTIGPTLSLARRKLSTKVQRAIDRGMGTQPRWAVAVRRLNGRAALELPTAFDLADYTLLPDDGQRFYADPFLFSDQGETYLFVEELPAATNRGLISVARILPDGSVTTPQPILEEPYHLSYPQVFARDGAIWMLPEGFASGGLVLYRADRLPGPWTPVARLIDEPLHDATLFDHDGRLWIAANTQGPPSARWGSSWDSLSLYSAPNLLGPWAPHPANPVLIDAAATRPAGPVFESNGALYRPVQDCRTGYGAVLALARIDSLTGHDFAQTIVQRSTFSAASGLVGPHTLNRLTVGSTTLEAIDVYGPAHRLRTAARHAPTPSGRAPRHKV